MWLIRPHQIIWLVTRHVGINPCALGLKLGWDIGSGEACGTVSILHPSENVSFLEFLIVTWLFTCFLFLLTVWRHSVLFSALSFPLSCSWRVGKLLRLASAFSAGGRLELCVVAWYSSVSWLRPNPALQHTHTHIHITLDLPTEVRDGKVYVVWRDMRGVLGHIHTSSAL